MLCNEQGGIKDDIFIYHTDPQEYLLCVNASNRAKIWTWLMEHTQGLSDMLLSDQSEDLAQLALQGPASRTILEAIGVTGLESLKPRQCLRAAIGDANVLITRTGYTGELGYELYVPRARGPAVWEALLGRGAENGAKPCGLGARDLLRLEMAYLLYGNDIGEDTTPFEASAGWVVDLQKRDFIGKSALSRQKEQGPGRKLVAFELTERGVPRHGLKVLSPGGTGEASTGSPIGEVTSGNFSPILQKGIGMAYVPPSYAASGTALAIDIRGKTLPAVVVKPPFYRKGHRP
jgi:aminomethyltransferase